MLTDIRGYGWVRAIMRSRTSTSGQNPEKRKVQFPLGLLGAKAEVRFEPKGVIGILSPWNFPRAACLWPADAACLPQGNRAMIKAVRIYRARPAN